MNKCFMIRTRFAVICGYLDSFKPLAEYTVEVNKREYCERHGYDLLIPRSVSDRWRDDKSHASGFSWSRLAFVLETLESGKYEWVWTVGADTLITNQTITLESLVNDTEDGKHLLICGERVAPIQSDSFILRTGKPAIGYVKDVLNHWESFKHHPWVENQVMIDLREKYAEITQIVPQWRMNSYDYKRFYKLGEIYRSGTDCYGHRGQWKQGDFLIHWPAATLTERLKFLQFYKPLIQYE